MTHTTERTQPRKVDFFTQATDFQCVLLASIGLSTEAIAAMTGLTTSQVMYRVLKAEQGRRKGQPTQRMQYRQGNSDIARQMIANVGTRNNKIKSTVVNTLNNKGLFAPVPTGVMENQR